MIIVLSPSKTLDFITKTSVEYTNPEFLNETFELILALRKLTKTDISRLMSISENLAFLNYVRYAHFSITPTLDASRPAIYAFKGDVYNGLAIDHYNDKDIQYAQNHLRIISGLYGLLTQVGTFLS